MHSIVWLTGLSGAGKTTLAYAVRRQLQLAGRGPVEILDGDQMRIYLSKDLGFSRADRDSHIRRIGFVARLLARHGVTVLVAAISPYADVRDEMRQLAEGSSIRFIEVFVDVPLPVLIKRDVKGLYRKALSGEIAHFTGVSDPYEPPLRPDIIVQSQWESVEESTEKILCHLSSAGIGRPSLSHG